MHYDDLTSCIYFGPEAAEKLTAIGWLEAEHPYTRATVSAPVLDKLFELLTKPWNASYFMGYHDCALCDYDRWDVTYKNQCISAGNLNLFVPGDGFLYVMPSLAAHYILAHGYAPPREFCDAVLRCPPMGSEDYFRAIVANGPPRYAEFARKHLVGSA